MLEINRLCFGYNHHGANVLNDVELKIAEGRMTTILGPNGSGKTTLFKCITGLVKPRQGTILFGGTELAHLSYEKRAKIMAVVPQEHEPPFPYSVLDAVMMGRVSHVSMWSSPSKHDCLKAEEAIETIGIGRLKNRPYTKISGGERQLVLIARALAQEAPILILDEPTSHLDFKNQVLVLNKVREIVSQKQLTVVMTLHDPNLATLFSDNIVMINGGRIMTSGVPQEVMTEANLKAMYGIDVDVISHNGVKVIRPRLNS
ncbi:MAG: ABC transporter ATP-binding protein [Deltaproteobacteria bacterium]|nr:ABC transporter ATP-binding protein [Deltaproteobacteria bacterium]